MKKANVSVVRYENSYHEIKTLVDKLNKATGINKIYVVDNSKTPDLQLQESSDITYIFNNDNLGFGKAHNLALRLAMAENIPFHIIVNPDISVTSAGIDNIIEFLEIHTEIGALMPKVVYPSGKIQRVCKLLPTPFDLFARRFLPNSLTKKRMKRYELHDSGYDKLFEIPYLCGCFMALRVDILRTVGLFDERFFLYPEDIDLSRRINERFLTVFYPDVTIVHAHKRESYNSLKLLVVHCHNIIRYFNKWGWISDKKRIQTNKRILEQVDKLNQASCYTSIC